MYFFPFPPLISKQINQLGPSALFSVSNFFLLPVSPFLSLHFLSLLCYFLNKFTIHFIVVVSFKVRIFTLLSLNMDFLIKTHQCLCEIWKPFGPNSIFKNIRLSQVLIQTSWQYDQEFSCPYFKCKYVVFPILYFEIQMIEKYVMEGKVDMPCTDISFTY